jgi:hypothetical protein
LAEYQRDYYKSNREKINKQHSDWQKKSWYYEKNRERILNRAKENYYKNKNK